MGDARVAPPTLCCGLAMGGADIAENVRAALAPWPRVDGERFVAHLRSLDVSADARLDDLALAFAATQQDPAALAALAARLEQPLRAAVVAAGFGAALADDAAQETLLGLLDGTHGGLARYQGRAALETWARTIAIRTATRMAQQHGAHGPRDAVELASQLAIATTPATRLQRAELRPILGEALRVALAEVSLFDRELLAQAIVEGRGIQVMADAHGVHRATMARWLGRAHHQLELRLTATLQARLGVAPDELASLMRCFDTSVGIAFGQAAQGTPR